jgi:hypothetical protein
MKTNATQQEILLITGTQFSSRQICDKNDAAAQTNLSEKEKLEEACWNGMIKDMLPEIVEKTTDNKRLYLWQIKEGESYIELELAEFPQEKDNYFSIDPYALMSVQLFS